METIPVEKAAAFPRREGCVGEFDLSIFDRTLVKLVKVYDGDVGVLFLPISDALVGLGDGFGTRVLLV